MNDVRTKIASFWCFTFCFYIGNAACQFLLRIKYLFFFRSFRLKFICLWIECGSFGWLSMTLEVPLNEIDAVWIFSIIKKNVWIQQWYWKYGNNVILSIKQTSSPNVSSILRHSDSINVYESNNKYSLNNPARLLLWGSVFILRGIRVQVCVFFFLILWNCLPAL